LDFVVCTEEPALYVNEGGCFRIPPGCRPSRLSALSNVLLAFAFVRPLFLSRLDSVFAFVRLSLSSFCLVILSRRFSVSLFWIRFCLRQAVVFISFYLVAMSSLRLHRRCCPRHPCCLAVRPYVPRTQSTENPTRILKGNPTRIPALDRKPGRGRGGEGGGAYSTRTCLGGGRG
jgi:hypothetical protein